MHQHHACHCHCDLGVRLHGRQVLCPADAESPARVRDFGMRVSGGIRLEQLGASDLCRRANAGAQMRDAKRARR